MGASLQWREPPERENHLHGDIVEFGRARSKGTGYLAHSDRVGPGVLLVQTDGERRADALNGLGFTTLVPRSFDARVLQAGAEFLSENWHPRLGVVAIGDEAADAIEELVEGRTAVDVLVVYEGLWPGAARARGPVVGHFSEEARSRSLEASFAAAVGEGGEAELYLYDGTRVGFCDPRSLAFDPQACALADERTADALEYHLS